MGFLVKWTANYEPTWETRSKIPDKLTSRYFARQQEIHSDYAPASRVEKLPTYIPSDSAVPSPPSAQPPHLRRSDVFILRSHLFFHSFDPKITFSLHQFSNLSSSFALYSLYSICFRKATCFSMTRRSPQSPRSPDSLR